MSDLTDLNARHRALAEAAGDDNPSGESWADFYECPEGLDGSFPFILPREAHHIAANDPDTVKAYCDVVGALEHFVSNYDDFAHHPEFTPVNAALDNLAATLGRE